MLFGGGVVSLFVCLFLAEQGKHKGIGHRVILLMNKVAELLLLVIFFKIWHYRSFLEESLQITSRNLDILMVVQKNSIVLRQSLYGSLLSYSEFLILNWKYIP